MSVRALVFDGYGTLFDIDSVIPECERVFPGYGAEVGRRWRVKQLGYTRRCVLTRHYVDLWTLMDRSLGDTCRALHLDISPQVIADLREQYLSLKPFPEVLEVLPRLRAKYQLAILSHGTQKMLDAVVDSTGTRGMFEEILSVDTVHAYKPAARAYALAEESLNLPRTEIAYVGVNPFDIAGAKGFGSKTIWVRRVVPASRLMALISDAQIASLEELPV